MYNSPPYMHADDDYQWVNDVAIERKHRLLDLKTCKPSTAYRFHKGVIPKTGWYITKLTSYDREAFMVDAEYMKAGEYREGLLWYGPFRMPRE